MKGQIAKWLIPPVYEKIYMTSGENLIVTDSLGKKIVWSHSGKRLSTTRDQILPFVEEMAVTMEREGGLITGFYNKNGQLTKLSGYNSTYAFPYFSNHHLLVHDGSYYMFVNANGEIEPGRYLRAYPFANGYASCYTYANIQKQKDPYNLLISEENEQISFSYEGKPFDNDDIEFISSVNDENIGVVVAKHKLYFFNGKNRNLSPVFESNNETNIKNQAKLENDITMCLSTEFDTITVLNAKCGKKNKIQIRFNSFLIPLSISSSESKYTYKKNTKSTKSLKSPLSIIKYDDLYGLSWNNKEILPPQLDNVLTCFDDKAFVVIGKKCGMLQIYKDEDFKITINKGNPIDFRHQKYETTIRLDLPQMISAHTTRIDVDPQSGCDVDMPSCQRRDTEFGNYIQYDCVLNIPDSLPDEMYGDKRNEITYPMHVVYDGLWSPMIPFKVKAWHYKYFNVDVNDAETSIHQGTLSFTFNINAERNPGEAVYPTTVNIQTDSLQFELEKISETRYKCKVLALKEGLNNIAVQIFEDGCPPATFPFEVTYVKPVAKSHNKPEVKENVVIKKKTKKTVSPVTQPYIEI